MVENVIIIGGGPAGLAAAIYNSRANLSPLVIAGSPPGGQLMLTTEIENYPGFESILGSELVEKMRAQAKKFGTRIIDENIIRVDFSKKPFKVNLSNEVNETNKVYWSNSILIATGAKALWLGLESEQRLRGRGVSACATCDGFFFKGKTVAVVGGGDTAMEEALTLTKFAEKVYIIHRRAEFRASKIMQERVLKHPKIEIIWNAVVEEIVGEKKVEGIKLRKWKEGIEAGQEAGSKKLDGENPTPTNNLPNQLPNPNPSSNFELRVDGVFIAIGHKPDTEIFFGQIELDNKGYIVTAERFSFEMMKSQIPNPKSQINSKFKILNSKFRSATSIPGVFAAGDCVDHVYRQAATAVGMGVAAALEIEKYIYEQ